MSDFSMIRQLQTVMDDFTGRGEECGCQLTVFRHGEKVCELCSGWTDPDQKERITPDTLFPVFSVGKGVVTTLIHILAEQGKIRYDDLVTDYWPEYGVNGKERTSVKHILSHRAGLYDFPAGITEHEKYDWEKIVPVMEKMAPLDTVGGFHHYHGYTYGILAGHLAELASGMDFRSLLRQEILEKLDIDTLFFGVPEKRMGKVALIDGSGFPPDPRTRMNDPAVLGGLNPSSNGAANATALAKLYSALLPSGYNGVRLLSPETVAGATRLCRIPEDVLDFARWDKFGLGYALCGPENDLGRMFGHGGACGSEGFADKETGYAVGFTKNRLNATHPDHPLRNAISEILGLPRRIW